MKKPGGRGRRVMLVLSLPDPRLTRWGSSVALRTFNELPRSLIWTRAPSPPASDAGDAGDAEPRRPTNGDTGVRLRLRFTTVDDAILLSPT